MLSDHSMVEKISPAIAHEAFGHSVLPGTSNRGAHRDDTQTFSSLQNFTLKCMLAIEDKEPGSKTWNLGVESYGKASRSC
jgi:hypothetical protein